MSASACTCSYAWFSLASHQYLVMPMSVGLGGVQEHPSCSPAGFHQPRSRDWISFSALWTIISREFLDLYSILMLAKVFRPCFFNLLWNMSCWSSPSLALDSWYAIFFTVWALSRSLLTSEGTIVSHSVHVRPRSWSMESIENRPSRVDRKIID